MPRANRTRKRAVRRPRAGDEIAIPVVQEHVEVGKVAKETGRVRVRIVPRTRVQNVDVPLAHEDVRVERVPINRVVDAPTAVRQEGDVTIIPIFEEVLTIQKKLVLREEVHITRQHTTQRQTRPVRLRAEEVEIVRTP